MRGSPQDGNKDEASFHQARLLADDPPYIQDAVIVKYTKGLSESKKDEIRKDVGADKAKKLSKLTPDSEVITVKGNQDIKKVIEKLLKKKGEVEIAEPDYLLAAVNEANDDRYIAGEMWGMYGPNTAPYSNEFGSEAGAAWARGFTGSSNVVVGVIDEGIDINHPDLQANIWFNPGETAGNGDDDDDNGYVDDINGWDFFNNDNSVFDAQDGDNHGTHCSGTIGATGNNGIGVVGVNWDVKIISAKFLGPEGGSTSDAIAAVDYLTDLKLNHGVNVVATSNSWGGGGFSTGLRDAIRRAGDADILFIAAAGNDGADNDVASSYPSNYDCSVRHDNGRDRGWDCMVSVASITSSGAKSSFSSYGLTTVDLGAPGSAIMSTVAGSSYQSYSGTSMATPHVSGAVALCAAANPSLSASAIRQALMDSTEATPSLAGRTVTGGRLNVDAMMDLCSPCLNDSECDDGNDCTTDSCVAGACTYTPIPDCCGDGVCDAGESLGTCFADCPDSISESNLSGGVAAELRYYMIVPSGATTVTFTMSGGIGDADLYVKAGSPPTISSYDCRPYTSGNNEVCESSTSGGEVHYAMVRGYRAFSGVSLQGSHNAPPGNLPPSAVFTHSVTNLQVAFTDVSTDIDGTVASWAWDFGDGSTSTQQSPTHTYAFAGTYTVTLTVTDDDGATNSANQAMTVTASPQPTPPPPPTPQPTPPPTPQPTPPPTPPPPTPTPTPCTRGNRPPPGGDCSLCCSERCKNNGRCRRN